MSGTSMDGIDVALILTDGQSQLQQLAHESYPYSMGFRQAMKYLEKETAQALGDLDKLRRQWPICDAWIQESTRLHLVAIQALIQKTGKKPDVVGYHGQTLYHRPDQAKTVQVGDCAYLAHQLQTPVVGNFRERDVMNGGQGAPLVPLYHRVLLQQKKIDKALMVNCGGIANATWIDQEEITASDLGPGSVLLDRWVREKTDGQSFFDYDGRWALEGRLDLDYLRRLRREAFVGSWSGFMEAPWPKSLDSHNWQLPDTKKSRVPSLVDGCHTLAFFTAHCLADSLLQGVQQQSLKPRHLVLCGGGWQHPLVTQYFMRRLTRVIKSLVMQTADELGWKNQAIEAEAFAYLAVRRLKGLYTSLPETTGVREPCVGGEVFC